MNLAERMIVKIWYVTIGLLLFVAMLFKMLRVAGVLR